MNALHVESERRTAAAKPQTAPIGKIALERIKSITVLRDGYPEYELLTTVDFEAFRNSYKSAKFLWTNGEWILVDGVKDLTAAIIKIRA